MTVLIYLYILFSADLYLTHAQGDDGKVADVTAVRGHLLKTAGEGPGDVWAESGWALGFD